MFGSGFGPGAFTLLSFPVLGPAVVTGAIFANTVTSVACSAGRQSGYRSNFPSGFANMVPFNLFLIYGFLRYLLFLLLGVLLIIFHYVIVVIFFCLHFDQLSMIILQK